MAKVKRVGIAFGDNDFYYTFTPLFEVIKFLIDLNDGLPEHFSKENIIELVNDCAFGIYKFVQCCDHDPNNSLQSYFKLTSDRIYFDNEIDNYLNDSWRHNGDFFYYDGYLKEIYCV